MRRVREDEEEEDKKRGKKKKERGEGILLARLCPFRYRYRIPVSVAVTLLGTVEVLNGTRYLRYPIPTSRCRYR